MDGHFALLNGAFNLNKESHDKLEIKQKDAGDGIRPIDDLCQKTVYVTKAINKLLRDSTETDQSVANAEKRLT
jgi:hypothetical protein